METASPLFKYASLWSSLVYDHISIKQFRKEDTYTSRRCITLISIMRQEMPSGEVSRPIREPEYGPPIDQICAMGSPVMAIAMTDSAAVNSSPKLYA